MVNRAAEQRTKITHRHTHILLNQLSSYIILYILFILNTSLSILFSILLPHDVFYIFTMFVEIIVGESPCTLLRLCRNKSEINPMGGRIKTF